MLVFLWLLASAVRSRKGTIEMPVTLIILLILAIFIIVVALVLEQFFFKMDIPGALYGGPSDTVHPP